MADVRVVINEAFIAWLATAGDSPVNVPLDAVADLVLAAAVARAPVSPKGSRYAPRGFLKARIVKADKDHDDSGELVRYVGTRTNKRGGAFSYPFSFISNNAGLTVNRGHRSRRKAIDYFISEAIDEVPYTVYEV